MFIESGKVECEEKMKKRFSIVLLTMMMATLLFGCGDKKEETADQGSIDTSEFVTLGEYKGVEVVVPPATVDELKKDAYVKDIFKNGVTEEVGIKDRAIENGDSAFISYIGKKDGEAFEGGTSDGMYLEIGSGQFIPGFEEGLLGVMPGETVDLNLTFPDPYQNAELAGQEVVFTVTVHYLMPEISDEGVAAMNHAEYSNVEELEQYVYDILMEDAEKNREMEVTNAVIQKIIENTTFTEIPESLIQKYSEQMRMEIESAASYYGVDPEQYVNMLYGMDVESMIASVAEEQARQSMLFNAIAEKEIIEVTEEEFDKNMKELVESQGITLEEFWENNDKNEVKEIYLYEAVIEFLLENAVVNEE